MIFVDAHVHVYPCFELSSFFSSAYRNFRSATAHLPHQEPLLPVIILADWSRQSWFRQFLQSAENPNDPQRLKVAGWSFLPTDEAQSVIVENAQGHQMIVLAGKKIISAENLEVLALGTTAAFQDGLSLQTTLEEIRRHPDAPIPVVPWAVGKWWGRRGEILEGVMRGADEPYFYLCDNGNRPFFWRRPSHFNVADELGIGVLAGSDPLHFRSDALRVGRFGFCLPGQLPAHRPGTAFKKILADAEPASIPLFGHLESGGRFIKNQIRMQIFKKKWKKELLR